MIVTGAFGQWAYDYSQSPMEAKIWGNVAVSDTVPSYNFYDAQATDGDLNARIYVDASDVGSGTEDIDFSVYQQVAGAELRTVFSDADQGIYLYPLGEAANPVSITTGGAVTVPDSLSVYESLWLNKGAQDYLFTSSGVSANSALAIQGLTSGGANYQFYAADDPAGADNFIQIFSEGQPGQTLNTEYLRAGWDFSEGVYVIGTNSENTGTQYPLRLNASGLTDNQLYLATGGQNIMGHNASIDVLSEAKLQVHGLNVAASISSTRWSANGFGSSYIFGKSRNATVGGYTIVENNDVLGAINFIGDDGADLNTVGAVIVSRIDGTPASNRIPAEIEFHTALGGADNDVALSAKLHKDAMLDLYGGTISILAGAEQSLKTRTSTENKYMRFGMPMHTTDTPNIASIIYAEALTAANNVYIGGGDAAMNAATNVYVYTGADQTTTTGSLKATFAGGANGLITLSGGTGGVRLDNTLGIGAAPDANRTIITDRTFTATATAYSMLLSDQITGNAGSNIYGLGITGTVALAGSGVHANVTDVFLDGKALGADTGADITNLSTLYIADAPSYAGTVTNGPYSIFVDAGDVRIDDTLRVASSGGFIAPTQTPSSATDTGTTGQIAWDADFIYVCIATNSWKRAAIAAGW